MQVRSARFFFLASTALTLSLLTSAAQAGGAPIPLPNLVNLNFTNVVNAPKGTFTHVDPAGWTGGSGLIFIDGQTPGETAADKVYLTTYGNPVGNITGNYVEADGNPTYESGFSYSVSGLTIGQQYTLSFYQGASEQTGFGLINNEPIPTTNQWIVSLGTQGLKLEAGGPVDPTYGATDKYYDDDGSASIMASPLMTVPYQGTVGWDYVSVTLTADATTDLLSFLAWGDDGSTVNLPPIAFLSGVDSPFGLGVAEPASMSLLGIGLVALGGIGRRRRARRSAAS